MNLRCLIVGHSWRPWRIAGSVNSWVGEKRVRLPVESRSCRRCGKYEERVLSVSEGGRHDRY